MVGQQQLSFSICDHGHDREYVQVVDESRRVIQSVGARFSPRAWIPADGLETGVYCWGCLRYALAREQAAVPLDPDQVRAELGALAFERPQARGHADIGVLVSAVLRRTDVVGAQHLDEIAREVVDLPSTLEGPIYTALRSRFPGGLYPAQVKALEAADRGDDVVQLTATASGKSVGLLYPALAVASVGKNALVVTPRNVLPEQYLNEFKESADEYHELSDGLIEFIFGSTWIRVGVLNGDVRGEEIRDSIRKQAQVLITNEYMFETQLLAWDKAKRSDRKWRRFFSNVALVVFDELDCKLGHERSTTMWSLRSVIEYITELSSRPQVLMASATIGDPTAFHAMYTGGGARVTVVDGPSHRHPRDLVLVRPDDGASVVHSAVDVVVGLVRDNGGRAPMTAVFVQSPSDAELVERELAGALKAAGFADQVSTIAQYTGPTDRSQRRVVESGVNRWQTRIIVATEALGIGADLGPLEVCVIAGCAAPQSPGKALQWMGRAGRRSRSLTVMILDESPLSSMLEASTIPFDELVSAAGRSPVLVVSNHVEKFFIRPLVGTIGYVPASAAKRLPAGVVEELVAGSDQYRLTRGQIVPVGEPVKPASLFTHSATYEAQTRDGHRTRLGLLHGAGRNVRGAELVLHGQWYRVIDCVREKRIAYSGSEIVFVLHVVEIEESTSWSCKFDYRVEDVSERRLQKRNGFKVKYSAGRVRMSFVSSTGSAPDRTFSDAGVVELVPPSTVSTAPSLAELVRRTAFALDIPTFDFYVEQLESGSTMIIDKHESGRMSWVIANAIIGTGLAQTRTAREAA
jgi:superfamily II DNA/RNA helicase